ncbi:HNH endonuclease [Methylobacterium sp. M6A4_1b]
MYKLGKPILAVSDVLASCIGALADIDLVARMNAVKGAIEANETLYETLATKSQLDLVVRLTDLGSVTKAELTALYEDHLSATRGAARPFYDAIKNAAPNKLCPLCSIGTVAHVDHHLPKSRYPDLSVLPLNLVPACHFCNDTKKARFPKTAGEQTFHPYYDAHLLTEQWITATLDYGTPLILVFSVAPPSTWSSIDQQRVARHFTVCGLGISFATNATANLGPLKLRLQRLHHRGGATAVQAHLEEERICHAEKPNSWQHVFFETLAADDWFVNGGFSQISAPSTLTRTKLHSAKSVNDPVS